MLRTRLWMGSLLIIVLVAGLWFDESVAPRFGPNFPPYPIWLLLALAAVLTGCRELLELLRHRGLYLDPALTYGSVVAVTVANWYAWFAGSRELAEHLVWPFGTLIVANMLMLVREAMVFVGPGTAVTSASSGMLVVFYLGGLAVFLIQMRWMDQGLLALATLVVAAKCGDIGAYFGGRALGRNKLAPRLSPGKTIEGSICGSIASVVGTLAVIGFGAAWSGDEPAMGWPAAALFGFLVGGLAQLGDLIESLIKRDCQQKDASALVPGFGGVLDVLDSPLFAAPLGFCLWLWLGPGWGGGLGTALVAS